MVGAVDQLPPSTDGPDESGRDTCAPCAACGAIAAGRREPLGLLRIVRRAVAGQDVRLARGLTPERRQSLLTAPHPCAFAGARLRGTGARRLAGREATSGLRSGTFLFAVAVAVGVALLDLFAALGFALLVARAGIV